MKMTNGFMLYVNDKPTRVSQSLEAAKALAAEHLRHELPLRIESYVAPAPSQKWNYDRALNQWVEER